MVGRSGRRRRSRRHADSAVPTSRAARPQKLPQRLQRPLSPRQLWIAALGVLLAGGIVMALQPWHVGHKEPVPIASE